MLVHHIFQLPGKSDHEEDSRQLRKGERFSSESDASSCGYEVVDGNVVVSMDMSKEIKDKSSLSYRNVATLSFKKGDCFGFISNSWSAVTGEAEIFQRLILLLDLLIHAS